MLLSESLNVKKIGSQRTKKKGFSSKNTIQEKEMCSSVAAI